MIHIQRTLRVMLLVVIPLVALSCRTSEEPRTPGTEQQDIEAVRAAVDAHWAAINSGDSAAVQSHHTPDITLMMPQFERRFGDDSDEVRQLVASGKPTIPLVLRDVQVRLLGGGSALATFYMDGAFWAQRGGDDRRTRRVTEVWIRQDGIWKEAHHHDSVYAPLQ